MSRRAGSKRKERKPTGQKEKQRSGSGRVNKKQRIYDNAISDGDDEMKDEREEAEPEDINIQMEEADVAGEEIKREEENNFKCKDEEDLMSGDNVDVSDKDTVVFIKRQGENNLIFCMKKKSFSPWLDLEFNKGVFDTNIHFIVCRFTGFIGDIYYNETLRSLDRFNTFFITEGGRVQLSNGEESVVHTVRPVNRDEYKIKKSISFEDEFNMNDIVDQTDISDYPKKKYRHIEDIIKEEKVLTQKIEAKSVNKSDLEKLLKDVYEYLIYNVDKCSSKSKKQMISFLLSFDILYNYITTIPDLRDLTEYSLLVESCVIILIDMIYQNDKSNCTYFNRRPGWFGLRVIKSKAEELIIKEEKILKETINKKNIEEEDKIQAWINYIALLIVFPFDKEEDKYIICDESNDSLYCKGIRYLKEKGLDLTFFKGEFDKLKSFGTQAVEDFETLYNRLSRPEEPNYEEEYDNIKNYLKRVYKYLRYELYNNRKPKTEIDPFINMIKRYYIYTQNIGEKKNKYQYIMMVSYTWGIKRIINYYSRGEFVFLNNMKTNFSLLWKIVGDGSEYNNIIGHLILKSHGKSIVDYSNSQGSQYKWQLVPNDDFEDFVNSLKKEFPKMKE